jgi:uncharacterized damage-inducible protein DinB
MSNITFGEEYLKELDAEASATQPHEKSMTMGYLALLVAEIPKWITYMIEKSEIDLGTFGHLKPKNTAELVSHFEENVQGAKNALRQVSNQALSEPFYLKSHGKVVYSSPKKENIGTSINHLVHHRGQLTVYMRLNNIPVPSIYGPSADDRGF